MTRGALDSRRQRQRRIVRARARRYRWAERDTYIALFWFALGIVVTAYHLRGGT